MRTSDHLEGLRPTFGTCLQKTPNPMLSVTRPGQLNMIYDIIRATIFYECCDGAL